MRSNTQEVEKKHLKVSTKKECVRKRGVTRLIIRMSHMTIRRAKTLPLAQLCSVTHALGGQCSNTHLFAWLTHVLTPATADMVSALAALAVCGCRSQVWIFCTFCACCHERHARNLPCTAYYSWQAGHRCVAISAAQELLTRLYLFCAVVKKAFVSVLCCAEALNEMFLLNFKTYGKIPLAILHIGT